MIRCFGETYDGEKTYYHRPGAYALLVRGGRVLLTWQNLVKPEIQLPGGGIDAFESPYQTLAREVYEETGWHFRFQRKLGTYRRFAYIPEYGRWCEKLCHIYLGQPTICLGPPKEPDHVAFWCAPENAVALLSNDGDRVFAAQYFERRS